MGNTDTVKHAIRLCLADKKWSTHRLAKEAGLRGDMTIRRFLSGERKGMNTENLLKIFPFIYTHLSHLNPKLFTPNTPGADERQEA